MKLPLLPSSILLIMPLTMPPTMSQTRKIQDGVGRRNPWVIMVLKWFNEKGRVALVDMEKLKDDYVTLKTDEADEADEDDLAGGWPSPTDEKEQNSGETEAEGKVAVDVPQRSRSRALLASVPTGSVRRWLPFHKSQSSFKLGGESCNDTLPSMHSATAISPRD